MYAFAQQHDGPPMSNSRLLDDNKRLVAALGVISLECEVLKREADLQHSICEQLRRYIATLEQRQATCSCRTATLDTCVPSANIHNSFPGGAHSGPECEFAREANGTVSAMPPMVATPSPDKHSTQSCEPWSLLGINKRTPASDKMLEQTKPKSEARDCMGHVDAHTSIGESNPVTKPELDDYPIRETNDAAFDEAPLSFDEDIGWTPGILQRQDDSSGESDYGSGVVVAGDEGSEEEEEEESQDQVEDKQCYDEDMCERHESPSDTTATIGAEDHGSSITSIAHHHGDEHSLHTGVLACENLIPDTGLGTVEQCGAGGNDNDKAQVHDQIQEVQQENQDDEEQCDVDDVDESILSASPYPIVALVRAGQSCSECSCEVEVCECGVFESVDGANLQYEDDYNYTTQQYEDLEPTTPKIQLNGFDD
jgi:hypothetical protein